MNEGQFEALLGQLREANIHLRRIVELLEPSIPDEGEEPIAKLPKKRGRPRKWQHPIEAGF